MVAYLHTFTCSGSGDTLSISDEQTIDEYVKYYHIKVSAILVPNDERLPMAFYDSVAQLSGGSSHVIRESRHRDAIQCCHEIPRH